MTSEDKIRTAFEKWYGSSPERNVKYPVQYLNVLTQARWEAWKAATEQQATELSQLRAEREGLVQWVEKEIAACLPGLPNHRLEDLQDFKSHLTRTEQKEGA